MDPRCLAMYYMCAKERVIEAGYAHEIDWQEEATLASVNEEVFLREAAWVILSAGFRESVLRNRFRDVSEAFLHWKSAADIVSSRAQCRQDALGAFNNVRKIEAILEVAERVHREGMGHILSEMEKRGVEFLMELPYVGAITSRHLAKNMGVDVAKPDRHMMRLALRTGYESVDGMCRTIASIVGDPLPVIDVVLWRSAVLGGVTSSTPPRMTQSKCHSY